MIEIDNEIFSDTLININKNYIISATIQKRENYYTFPKHTHRTAEIYYFIEGCCKMDIGDEVINASTGYIIIIPPNILHSFYLETKEKTKFIHIHIDANDLELFLIMDNNIKINLISILSINNYYKIIADKNLKSLLYSIINEKKNTSIISKATM